MKAKPALADFLQYERVLWRVLLSLSKSGFFIPPDDARDVIHDFYVEAWDGLTQRFDASITDFPSYVAGAFYRFARRRAVQMEQARRRVAQLRDFADLPALDAGPAASLESKQRAQAVKAALLELPALDRTLLLEYLGEGDATERALAARHGLTRYAVRAKLAAAARQLSQSLGQTMSERSPAQPTRLQRFQDHPVSESDKIEKSPWNGTNLSGNGKVPDHNSET